MTAQDARSSAIQYPECGSHVLPKVHICYLDHMLFRNANHSAMQPVLRETVGFLAKENEEAIWVLWDKSVQSLPNEKTTLESGLVLLKNCIVSLKIVGNVNNDKADVGQETVEKRRKHTDEDLNFQTAIVKGECALLPKKRKTHKKGESRQHD